MFGIDDAIGIGAGLVGLFGGGGGGNSAAPVIRQQLQVLRQAQDFYKSIDFEALKRKEADYITKGNAHDANLAMSNYRAGLAQRGIDPGAYDTMLAQGAAQTAYDSAVDGNEKLAGLDAKYLNLQKSLMPNASDYNGAIQAASQQDAIDRQNSLNLQQGIAQIGGYVAKGLKPKSSSPTSTKAAAPATPNAAAFRDATAGMSTIPGTKSYSIEDALNAQAPRISLSDSLRALGMPRSIFGR